MAGDSSFDIVSKLDHQEVDNAVNQTAKEISQRFDFKNTGASIALARRGSVIDVSPTPTSVPRPSSTCSEGEADQARPVAEDPRDRRAAHRPARRSRSSIDLKEGISQEQAKKVSKLIRDEGPKGVKVQVQGDELRVTSKKRDDLQSVIALVKEQDYDFAVQFTNYR